MSALQDRANVMVRKPSKVDRPAVDQETSKLSKRARENDLAYEDSGNQLPPNPKRRSKGLSSPAINTEASPALVDRKVSSPAVENKLAKQKQKAGPTGFKFPTEAESPPPWSWDVTGKWTLTCPRLTNKLGLDDSATQMMTIHLANNPRHTKVGRQYWATFDFGDGCFVGNMRFCPHMDSSIRGDIDLADFEKACVLKRGAWVGPPPNGLQKWNLRWRGVNTDSGVVEGSSDQYQTDVEFTKSGDRNLMLNAVFVFRSQPMFLRGVKTGEAKPSGGNDTSITRQWLRYKPRYI
jgi:hypothetical protein